ncbi:hypothetical protein Pf1_00200 [Flavobacterium columnare]|nr:hypothetical protein [Flavobacterium columnare]ANO48448.1 hypothetical protein Pf1_00200 [Flavobacterium columnare]
MRQKIINYLNEGKMFVFNVTLLGYQSAGAGVTALRGFTLS